MGRHSRRLQRVRGAVRKQAAAGEEDEQTEREQSSVNIHEENFFRDEIDEFHDAKEKLLLEGHSGSSEDDGLSAEEEEVLGWSEEEEEEEEEESEEEEEEEFKLPPGLQRQLLGSNNEEPEKNQTEIWDKAWGRRKKTFYAVEGEEELSGSEGSEMAAELEEKEAIALQQRMAAALSEADFMAPALPGEDGELEEGEEKEEHVVQDFSRMSRKDKLALLEKESPELFDLLEDFDVNMSEAVQLLQFQSKVARDSPTFTKEGREYLDCKLHLDLLYCMNIMFYLYLKASGVPVKSHPVIQRIVEIKKLIGQVEPLASEMEGQIEALLVSLNPEEKQSPEVTEEKTDHFDSDSSTEESAGMKSRKRKQEARDPESGTNINSSKKKRENISKSVQSVSGEEEEDPLDYYDRVTEEKKRKREGRREERGRRYEEEADREEIFEEGEDGKRAVTYQISRNRGLIPQRKKELRNPRVKHRNKFRKALIKHKGQVREVVKELTRYGGETTGIRANVSHSIKIK